MATLLYLLARALIGVLQTLPLRLVARLGRAGGELAYILDARHRRVTITNLTLCFGREKSPAEIRALARENFRRIGENYCCAIKTAVMRADEIRRVLEVAGLEKIYRLRSGQPLENRVMCIGHFGNFELYARCVLFTPGYQFATTYRALRQPALNRLLQDLRGQSGCLFFERRTESDALKAALNRGGLVLGLLADQHAGDKGLRLPFFGHDCSTNAAPAVLALRYRCPIFTAFCYRTGLAHWRIEVGDEIPTHENGQPRPVEAIMSDMNRAFETAIRRDPTNWFWVHKRWKPQKNRSPEPATAKDSTEATSCNSQ
jgi:KDO2-lipid IV(A) lauroyltransferase